MPSFDAHAPALPVARSSLFRHALLVAAWVGLSPLLIGQTTSSTAPTRELASAGNNDLPDAPGLPSASADPLQTPSASTPAAAQDPASSSSSSAAQTAPGQTSPTAAPPQTAPAAPATVATDDGKHQTKRILGIVPNYRSVAADQQLPPQSPKEKFTNALHDSFDYGSFVLAAIQAGFAMNSDSYPEFHQGVAGYGRYYWHTLADTADENLMVGGIYPTLLRQDARYYTLGHGSFEKRATYAFTRTLITRTDHGRETFNASEIIGAGSAAGISATYYPAAYRTWTKVGQKWLTQVIIDGANFTFKEFWPDINKRVFRNRGGLGSDNQ